MPLAADGALPPGRRCWTTSRRSLLDGDQDLDAIPPLLETCQSPPNVRQPRVARCWVARLSSWSGG